MTLASLRSYAVLILVATLCVVAGIAVHQARTARAALLLEQLALGKQRQLNDSTVAILAKDKLTHDTLQALLIAKDQLQGKLIAGVRVHVAARDTIVVHDTLVTTLAADSTRTASFRDSTFAGTVAGQVTAPPCCAPLRLTYTLHRPAFDPSIGVVQVAGKAVIVVTWQGERVELQGAFADIPVAPRRLGTFIEGGVSWPDQRPFGRAGAFARGWGLSAFGAVEQDMAPGQLPRVQAGLRKEF